MAGDELVYVHLAANFLVSLLKENWQNVPALYIHSTTGKPQRLPQAQLTMLLPLKREKENEVTWANLRSSTLFSFISFPTVGYHLLEF